MQVDKKAMIPILVAFLDILIWLYYLIGGDAGLIVTLPSGNYKLACVAGYTLCIIAGIILIMGALMEEVPAVWTAAVIQLVGVLAYIVSPFLCSFGRNWDVIIIFYFLMLAVFGLVLYTAYVYSES